jgi:predicted flap endonuclease-1-like 5' DNA nuclease
MWYLLNAYWIPLLLAGLLGVIVGWMSCDRHSSRSGSHGGWLSGWIPWAVAGTALAALAVLNAALPGKQGLLLETALMLFSAYMLGCCIGCILKPKPAAHLAHASAGSLKSGASGKAATAAAVGTAATAAGLAALKTASAPAAGKGATGTGKTGTGKTGTSATATASASGATARTETSAKSGTASGLTSNASTGSKPSDAVNGSKATATGSAAAASTGKVVTALGAAATGVAAAAASTSASADSAAATGGSGGDGNIKVVTGAAKFGERPVLYNAPRGGKGDELSLIWGVAEKLEHKMNAAGIWHFDQIANWTQANVEWFEHEFEGFKGRLDRDKWIEQCKKLAAGWRPDGHVGQRPKG